MVERASSREDWTNTRVVDGVTFRFGWQIDKDLGNRRDHGYPLVEAIPIILSEEGVEDPDDGSGEERWKVIAPAPSGRLLVAIYQDVSDEGGSDRDPCLWDFTTMSDASDEAVRPARKLERHLPNLLRRAKARKARAEARLAALRSGNPVPQAQHGQPVEPQPAK